MKKKEPPKRRPVRKARSLKAAALAKSAAPAERSSWWRVAVALAAAVAVAFGAFRTVRAKVAQHVLLESVGPLVPQGDQPGNLSGMMAIKADGAGGIFTLSRVSGPLWRVQHFDAGLVREGHAELLTKTVGELSDLAVLPDGGLWLANLSGALIRLDPGLKPVPRGQVKTGRSELRSLDRLPDGRLLALDVAGSALVFLDAQGKFLQETPVKSASGAHCVALVPEGLAWLEFRDMQTWVRVLDLDGKTLRRFLVQGVNASPPDRLAASGEALIINDSAGALGVVFYTVRGRPLGNNLGVGSSSIVNPGFVAGDPAGGIAYIHFGPGLIKVRLPWREIP